jgi:hypothetical protein
MRSTLQSNKFPQVEKERECIRKEREWINKMNNVPMDE